MIWAERRAEIGRWWSRNGPKVLFIAMLFLPMAMLSYCAAVDSMERERDAIAYRCHQIAKPEQACPMSALQKRQADRDRRRAEDEARWDREAKRILGQ